MPAIMPSKRYKDMTREELMAEYDSWTFKIQNAKTWGASLAAADEFRKDIARELRRRGESFP